MTVTVHFKSGAWATTGSIHPTDFPITQLVDDFIHQRPRPEYAIHDGEWVEFTITSVDRIEVTS